MLSLLLRVAFGAGSLLLEFRHGRSSREDEVVAGFGGKCCESGLGVDGDWAKNRGQSIARLHCRYVAKRIIVKKTSIT